MKSSAKKVKLASVDDLFSTEESRADVGREKVMEIPLAELHAFEGHPFKVKDDESMLETAESVRQYGVLVPAIARPRAEGGYELIAGHRRHRASELAEKETMPVIVRDLDDDAATIIMVDSNLQRESLLPSERAFAYKMKLDAMKHQGERLDLTCAQVGHKSDGKKSRDILAEQVGQSKNQIQRFIRLTELIPPLLDRQIQRITVHGGVLRQSGAGVVHVDHRRLLHFFGRLRCPLDPAACQGVTGALLLPLNSEKRGDYHGPAQLPLRTTIKRAAVTRGRPRRTLGQKYVGPKLPQRLPHGSAR